MVDIIPAILTKDSSEFFDMLEKARRFSRKIHLDIADGIFVPNQTIGGIEELSKIKKQPLIASLLNGRLFAGKLIETVVHLMIAQPENSIAEWLKTAASGYIFHIEAVEKPQELIAVLKRQGKKIGIALNPKTNTDLLEPHLERINFVHFMTVEPGFYGSKFEDSVVQKIADFHKLHPSVLISVDGGVTPETAPRLVKAGANILISGSYIFKSPDPAKAFKELKQSVYQFKNSFC